MAQVVELKMSILRFHQGFLLFDTAMNHQRKTQLLKIWQKWFLGLKESLRLSYQPRKHGCQL